MITIDDIIFNKQRLEARLKRALSTMELSGEVRKIQMEIKENQELCPHFSTKYNWVHNGKCPYCGKKE